MNRTLSCVVSALMVLGFALAGASVPGCEGVHKRPGLIDYVVGVSRPGIEVSLLSVNLGGDEPDESPRALRFRLPGLVKLIQANAPDVLGVQGGSAAGVRQLAEHLPGMVVAALGTSTGVLVRGDRFEVIGGEGLTALRERSTGHGLWVTSVELASEPASQRNEQAARLARLVAALGPDQPVLVMGDLGGGEGSAGVRALARAGANAEHPRAGLIDTFRVVHEDAQEVGTIHEETGRLDGPKRDYILAPRGTLVSDAQIIRARVEGRFPSPRYPVSATVRLAIPVPDAPVQEGATR